MENFMFRNFVIAELFLLTIFNLLIFFKNDSIIKTFISLFQMFSILLIFLLTRSNDINSSGTTFYFSIFIILNFFLEIMILYLTRKSFMIKKTDRNFRPDEYDE